MPSKTPARSADPIAIPVYASPGETDFQDRREAGMDSSSQDRNDEAHNFPVQLGLG